MPIEEIDLSHGAAFFKDFAMDPLLNIQLDTDTQYSAHPDIHVSRRESTLSSHHTLNDGRPSKHPARPGGLRGSLDIVRTKLGGTAILALALGNTATLAALGVLIFVWCGDRDNALWRYVVINSHLLTVVSGISKLLELSMAAVLSVCSAIVAAILFERHEARLVDAAAISMARYHGGLATVWLVLRKQIRVAPFKAPFLLSIIVLGILVFSSTTTVLLNSDIGIAFLPNYPVQQMLKVSPNVTKLYAQNDTWRINHGTRWLVEPPLLPSFTQYTEPFEPMDGVVDTGVTLRSYIPLLLSDARIYLNRLNSKAMVFDSRVSCQAPILESVNISFSNSGPSVVQLDSVVRPSKLVPGLFNHTLKTSGSIDSPTEIDWDVPIPISCLVPVSTSAKQYSVGGYQQPWRSSICQLPNGWNTGSNRFEYSGGLISVFQSQSITNDELIRNASWESWQWGNAFLILNLTSGSSDEVAALAQPSEDLGSNMTFARKSRNEWIDLVNGNLTLSASLCYSSFMTADMPISVRGEVLTTETRPRYDSKLGRMSLHGMRWAMGQKPNTGVSSSVKASAYKELSPRRSTWLVTSEDELPPVEPYMRNTINMWNYQSGVGAQTAFKVARSNGKPIASHNGSISAFMLQPGEGKIDTPGGAAFILSDPFLSDFFQDVVTTGGGIAFALQSLFYAMTAGEFYSRLTSFDNEDQDGTTITLLRLNVPVRRKGFTAVLVISLFYVIVVVGIVWHFLWSCQYAMLGNGSWRILSQTISPVTSEALAVSNELNDDEIDAMLRKQGKGHMLIALDKLDSGRAPVVVERGSTRGAKNRYDDSVVIR